MDRTGTGLPRPDGQGSPPGPPGRPGMGGAWRAWPSCSPQRGIRGDRVGLQPAVLSPATDQLRGRWACGSTPATRPDRSRDRPGSWSTAPRSLASIPTGSRPPGSGIEEAILPGDPRRAPGAGDRDRRGRGSEGGPGRRDDRLDLDPCRARPDGHPGRLVAAARRERPAWARGPMWSSRPRARHRSGLGATSRAPEIVSSTTSPTPWPLGRRCSADGPRRPSIGGYVLGFADERDEARRALASGSIGRGRAVLPGARACLVGGRPPRGPGLLTGSGRSIGADSRWRSGSRSRAATTSSGPWRRSRSCGRVDLTMPGRSRRPWRSSAGFLGDSSHAGAIGVLPWWTTKRTAPGGGGGAGPGPRGLTAVGGSCAAYRPDGRGRPDLAGRLGVRAGDRVWIIDEEGSSAGGSRVGPGTGGGAGRGRESVVDRAVGAGRGDPRVGPASRTRRRAGDARGRRRGDDSRCIPSKTFASDRHA